MIGCVESETTDLDAAVFMWSKSSTYYLLCQVLVGHTSCHKKTFISYVCEATSIYLVVTTISSLYYGLESFSSFSMHTDVDAADDQSEDGR